MPQPTNPRAWPEGDQCADDTPHYGHTWGWRAGKGISCRGVDGPNRIYLDPKAEKARKQRQRTERRKVSDQQQRQEMAS